VSLAMAPCLRRRPCVLVVAVRLFLARTIGLDAEDDGVDSTGRPSRGSPESSIS